MGLLEEDGNERELVCDLGPVLQHGDAEEEGHGLRVEEKHKFLCFATLYSGNTHFELVRQAHLTFTLRSCCRIQ